MKRLLSPSTNATGLGAAVAAIYAAVQMIVNLTSHKSGYGFDPQVIVAAVAAGWLFYTRFKVTPVASPRDGNGQPLAPVPPPPAPSNVTLVPGSASAERVAPPPEAHP